MGLNSHILPTEEKTKFAPAGSYQSNKLFLSGYIAPPTKDGPVVQNLSRTYIADMNYMLDLM